LELLPERLPRRPRCHELDDEAEVFVRQVFPSSWTIERVQRDYGTDLLVHVFEGQQATAWYFMIQLKGTHRPRRLGADVLLSCKRASLNFWNRHIFPVMVVLYDAESRVGYWLWVQEYVRSTPSLQTERARRHQSCTIKLPARSALTKEACLEIASFARQWHERIRRTIAAGVVAISGVSLAGNGRPGAGSRMFLDASVLAQYAMPGVGSALRLRTDLKGYRLLTSTYCVMQLKRGLLRRLCDLHNLCLAGETLSDLLRKLSEWASLSTQTPLRRTACHASDGTGQTPSGG